MLDFDFFRPASARNPESSGLRPKTEKFSLHFFDVARPNFFQKGKENFLFCLSAFGGEFRKFGTAESENNFYFSLFISLAALDPPDPFADGDKGTPIFWK